MDNAFFEASNATPGEMLHPYYPLDAPLPTYVVNSMPTVVLLSYFSLGCTAIFAATHLLVQRVRPGISWSTEVTTMWFILCGFIHLFFEGYFSVNSLDIAGRSDLFGQLWKEYSLSDSRYLMQDSFLVCMETITAVLWGPLSFVCAYFIVTDHPARHPLQMLISSGQLYGDFLYFGTCSWNEIVHHMVHCRPERIYFWAYYFFCNAVWIVIPGYLVYRSFVETTRAFAHVKAAQIGGKKNL